MGKARPQAADMGCVPDSRDISSPCGYLLAQKSKARLCVPVRASRSHYWGHPSLIFSGLWDVAPEEGEAHGGAFITQELSGTGDYHPHAQLARSFEVGIARPPVTALSLLSFPLLAHTGLPELLEACLSPKPSTAPQCPSDAPPPGSPLKKNL